MVSMSAELRTFTIELEGNPLVNTSAPLEVTCKAADGTGPHKVIKEAKKGCMVSNSLRQGIPVEFVAVN